MTSPSQADVLDRWPPPWPEDVLPEIQRTLAAAPRKVFILDDDPTGTQTITGLPVLTHWSVTALEAEFNDPAPGCFLLTNSRALPPDDSERLHHEIAQRLTRAAAGRAFSVISRSDSTLRGHFPLETDALTSALGGFDVTLLSPYFEAGGRWTIGGTHYVMEGAQLLPAAATPFAQDPAFGYRESHLPRWVEEKTLGRISADTVGLLDLALIRNGGPAGVSDALRRIRPSGVVVADACCPRDVEVLAAGVIRAEAAGCRILARTAASYVAARVGQRPSPLLDAASLGASGRGGGLIIAGSYVPKTTEQLERLRAARGADMAAFELPVADLFEGTARDDLIARMSARVNQALEAGRDTLVFTSRTLRRDPDAAGSLATGQRISHALVALVQALEVPPRYLVAKGGITSSDVATLGLGVRRALVLGQLLPGVPVWRLGPESRFPGLPYIVFPGNVGTRDALTDAVCRLAAPPSPTP